jgi:hypothetical protein
MGTSAARLQSSKFPNFPTVCDVTPTGEPLPETIPMMTMSVYIAELSSLWTDSVGIEKRLKARGGEFARADKRATPWLFSNAPSVSAIALMPPRLGEHH